MEFMVVLTETHMPWFVWLVVGAMSAFMVVLGATAFLTRDE
jgi:hypothetical protein